RLIRVYDSSGGSRKRVSSEEINQLFVMLPNYLHDSGFFDKTDRINWLSFEAYKDKETGELLGPQHYFTVEYAHEIMQQQNDSLDCGLFVAAYAEYLRDEIKISSVGLQSDYLCNRYETLFWKYGMDKFKAGCVSHSDDPTRPKDGFSKQAEDALVDVD
ncbi:hypothetical protein EJD97_005201, partial [Solanum chilense]